MTDTPSLTYADAGVDIDAGNDLVDAIKPLAKATRRPGSTAALGGFGAAFDPKAAGLVDPIFVATTDGVGTKLKIAIETGVHDHIGIDLVAMCVNDLLAQGAQPLMFLDYYACGALDVAQAKTIISGIAKGCLLADCALAGGETAEMPGMYAEGDYDLAGFAIGAYEREAGLPQHDNMQPGDVIIGLASDGVHANGYSLLRKVVARSGLNWHDPAPFGAGQSLAEACLTPTRIYVKSVMKAVHAGLITGGAHITGGGLVENPPRALPDHLTAKFDDAALTLPPIFEWLQEVGNIETAEMRRTFNCGTGFIVICSPDQADKTLHTLRGQGEQAEVIGELVSA